MVSGNLCLSRTSNGRESFQMAGFYASILAVIVVAAIALWAYRRDAQLKQGRSSRSSSAADHARALAQMQATVQPQEAYPERAGVGGGRTRKDPARAPSAATISSPRSTTVARAITATAFDALTWVGPLHPMSFGSLRLNQPMTY